MEFLRKHLFHLICGVVGVAGIGLSAWGIAAMSEVDNAMQAAVSIQNSIESARRDPKGMAAIEAAQTRIDRITANYERVLDLAQSVGEHKQLMEGFFPSPSYEAKVEFPARYREALAQLLQQLHAGDPPSAYEIDDEVEQLEAEALSGDTSLGVDPSEAGYSGDGRAEEEEIPTQHPSGLITDAAAKRSPEVRAAIKKAWGIYCYANLTSLDVNERVYYAAGAPPEVLHCWDAQQALWVQQDVIESLARTNNRAAQKLKDEGQRPWVGTLPIKDLISLRVSDYVFVDSEGTAPAPPGGYAAAIPPRTPIESFTGNYSNSDYLVVHFTLKMVVDSRDLPTIVAELSKDNFATLFRVAYTIEPANLSMTGKIYGPEPVVNVVMDFDRCFFCQLLAPLVPDAAMNERLPIEARDTITRLREEAENTG